MAQFWPFSIQMCIQVQHQQVDGSAFKDCRISERPLVSTIVQLNQTYPNDTSDHMNHAPMEDPPRASRTLQADDRNEKLPVMLCEMSTKSSSPIRMRAHQQSGWQSPPPQYTNTPNPQEVLCEVSNTHLERLARISQLTA